jgi:seryl-tRNA synthetase
MVPNAQRTKLDKTIALWRKKAKALEAQLGRAIDTDEEAQPAISTEDFKLAHSALRAELATVREKLAKLIVQRKRLPKRITVREALGEDEQALALTVEHKHFMNILKMAVYRAESALYRLLEPHYRRNDQEGRALLREAFRASGSLALHEGYLKVTLEPLSAPRRSRAIAALCRDLNATATRIPGTSLKLQFDVQSQECLKCA